MTPVADPFMAGVAPRGLQKGRGGFLRSADDAPYVTDPSGEVCTTGDRKGEVRRVKYGSPSNRGREIENDAGLVKYKQRLSFLGIGMSEELREACKDLALLEEGSDEFRHAADLIAVEADRLTRSWLAADRGTHGHLITELADRGVMPTTSFVQDGYALGLNDDIQDAVH